MRTLDAVRILELANKAYFLYFRQPPAEKAKLLTNGAFELHKLTTLTALSCLQEAVRSDLSNVMQSKEWLAGLDSN